MSYALEHLGHLVKVRVEQPRFSGIVSPEPHFELIVSLTNATVFTLNLVEGIGFIKVNANRYGAEPQLSQRPSFRHGETVRIRVHQPITPQTAEILLNAGNKDEHIVFVFSEFRLIFEIATGGSEGRQAEIPLGEGGFHWVPKP